MMEEKKVNKESREKTNKEMDKAQKLQSKIKELENKIKELEEKNQELEEKLIRNQAESINYRKRKDEEYQKMVEVANAEVIKAILPYLDDFERAVAMDDDNPDDEVSKFLAGFIMIYENFMNALYQFNLKEIDGINKPFDPIYHEALMKEKVEGQEPGMVIEILEKGYLLNDRVLRPAKVKVSE